ncbi:MAG: formyltransferase [Burkholderiaceae bacterium]|nr:MAG: formyltransferase [Burkholderiaceae bacterium]
MTNPSAIVFAYHSVGVCGIKTLLAKGVDIKLVVSHEDNPNEVIWFESVAALCAEHGIPRVTPENPNTPEFIAQLRELNADFFFSFYYRNMLSEEVLKLARRGAYNLHGSLLPKYRGRVPVNWAVLHGETETGATLHEMTVKPDAGAIIAQVAVPILPDDTAFEVFGKLTVAAEQTLWQALPGILSGAPNRIANELSKGSYFGGRKPEDGRIDWSKPAQQVYNLHRAVAPPYPGAFFDHAGKRFVIEKARMVQASDFKLASNLPQGISVVDNTVFGICGDGHAIRILALQSDNKTLSVDEIKALFA